MVSQPKKHVNWQKVDAKFQETLQRLVTQIFSLRCIGKGPQHQVFHVFTDWSSEFIGFVCFQKISGTLRLVQIGSHRNKQWKKNTSSYLGELWGVYWSLRQLLWLLRGATTFIHTDSLSIVKRMRDGNAYTTDVDARILRIWGFLASNFTIGDTLRCIFVEGARNQIADLLSRWASKIQMDKVESVKQETTETKPENLIKSACTNADGLQVCMHNQQAVLHHIHKGHIGINAMCTILRMKGIQIPRAVVRKFCAECLTCQRYAQNRNQLPWGGLDAPKKPGSLLSLDFIGPLPVANSGHRYICVLGDHLSRYIDAVPCKTANSLTALAALTRWHRKHTKEPDTSNKRILVDAAAYFKSRKFWEGASRLGYTVLYAPGYAHQSVGKIERMNKVVINRVRKMSYDLGNPEKHWISVIGQAVDIINATPHSVTLCSPRALHFALC